MIRNGSDLKKSKTKEIMYEYLSNKFFKNIKTNYLTFMKKITQICRTLSLEDVRAYVCKGDLRKALSVLEMIVLNRRDDILALRCRLAILENDRIRGVITCEFFCLEHQKIVDCVLLLCSQIESND